MVRRAEVPIRKLVRSKRGEEDKKVYLPGNCKGAETTVSKVVDDGVNLLAHFAFETTELNDLINHLTELNDERSLLFNS